MYFKEIHGKKLTFQFASNSHQKKPSRGVLRKRRSENMQQIYGRTPTPKCDFNIKVQFQNRTLASVLY